MSGVMKRTLQRQVEASSHETTTCQAACIRTEVSEAAACTAHALGRSMLSMLTASMGHAQRHPHAFSHATLLALSVEPVSSGHRLYHKAWCWSARDWLRTIALHWGLVHAQQLDCERRLPQVQHSLQVGCVLPQQAGLIERQADLQHLHAEDVVRCMYFPLKLGFSRSMHCMHCMACSQDRHQSCQGHHRCEPLSAAAATCELLVSSRVSMHLRATLHRLLPVVLGEGDCQLLYVGVIHCWQRSLHTS